MTGHEQPTLDRGRPRSPDGPQPAHLLSRGRHQPACQLQDMLIVGIGRAKRVAAHKLAAHHRAPLALALLQAPSLTAL